jgi:hypothetical protein
MHCIYFSRFVFDEFIDKGGENVPKVVCVWWVHWQRGRECAQSDRTLLLTGWLREVCGKHYKFYLRGRACVEKVKGSVEFFFTFSIVVCHLLAKFWVLRFSYSRWPFLSLSLGCCHLVMLQLVFNLKFKLCTLSVVNVLIKGKIEKPSGLCLGLYVWWVIDLF